MYQNVESMTAMSMLLEIDYMSRIVRLYRRVLKLNQISSEEIIKPFNALILYHKPDISLTS